MSKFDNASDSEVFREAAARLDNANGDDTYGFRSMLKSALQSVAKAADAVDDTEE